LLLLPAPLTVLVEFGNWNMPAVSAYEAIKRVGRGIIGPHPIQIGSSWTSMTVVLVENLDPTQDFFIFSQFPFFYGSNLCGLGGGLSRPQNVRAHAHT
jgi:hypothetical protein